MKYILVLALLVLVSCERAPTSPIIEISSSSELAEISSSSVQLEISSSSELTYVTLPNVLLEVSSSSEIIEISSSKIKLDVSSSSDITEISSSSELDEISSSSEIAIPVPIDTLQAIADVYDIIRFQNSNGELLVEIDVTESFDVDCITLVTPYTAFPTSTCKDAKEYMYYGSQLPTSSATFYYILDSF